MTPQNAIERASSILERAEEAAVTSPEITAALIQVAQAWIGLADSIAWRESATLR